MAGYVGATADSETSEHCIVRWQLPPMKAAAQYLLMVQLLTELRGLHHVRLMTSCLHTGSYIV